ncbi:penicillin-binding protein 2 [Candidatus Parcubacteria bacterium]|nr:penicillin-binding protein 2 [Patescibacteria group bacterium]MBU4380745.1 penicillin-binding protein 2 [Patescibacteria group bacterium]MCG2688827.1 penicillin-binding protein 2 [Candidatus Parcubacteria bacterium]
MLLKTIGIRIALVQYFVVGVALVFLCRLFYIQIICHKALFAKASSQQVQEIVIPASRGSIHFSDLSPLASSQTAYFLFAEPRNFTDKDKSSLVLYLKDKFKLDSEVVNRLNDVTLWYVPIKHGISPEEKVEIEKNITSGIVFKKEDSRFFPEEDLAVSVVGVVASDENGLPQGYFGVEGFYNSDLKGKSGRIISETDAFGNAIIMGSYTEMPSISGTSIVLSLDRAVQYLLEERLKYYLASYGAKSASAVVIECETGKILGMASFLLLEEDSKPKIDSTSNLVISDTYEPGSVFKAFTMSSAIDLNLVTPETSFEDTGPKYYSGHKVDTWDGKHYGTETMYEVLEHSNNLGAAWVAERLGSENLWKYLVSFGMGTPLGVDLEGEQTGQLRHYSTWRDIDLATASFGQGVSATALQVVNGFGAIANGGELLKPYLAVNFVENMPNGDTKIVKQRNLKTIISRVISQKTSFTMVDMLTRATSSGEAKFFISKKYQVAGKTGTAQIAVEGGYDLNKTNATFVGFLPKSRKFVMLVRFSEPTTSIYAAETAVPAWMDIAEKLALYYRIPYDY